MQTVEGLRERKSAQARAATLDAGFRLFGERGYDQVTVADICAAADIGRRTFFHYFPAKEDLLVSPVREMSARLTGAVDQLPGTDTDGQVIRAAFADQARYALAHRERMAQYRQIVMTAETVRASTWNLSEHERRTAQLLRDRHGGGPPDLANRLLVARVVAGFRVWLDVVIGDEDSLVAAGDDAGRLCLLDDIFDTDPLLTG